MSGKQIALGVLAALGLSVFLMAQAAQSQSGADPSVGPMSISGLPTSALHCVSGNAANVHGLGWLEAGTAYTITFDSTITLNTAVERLDLEGDQGTIAYGTPDIRFTASTSGTMALYVGGRGSTGCYRYKVEIQPPSRLAAGRAAVRPAVVKAQKSPIHSLAFSGNATSAKQCLSGNFMAKVHGLGRVEAGSQVTISFDSDFDPIAGVTLVNLDTQYSAFLTDDDSGGDLQPSISFTAPQAATVALFVASYGGDGCYRYKVEVQSGSTSTTTTTTPTTSTTSTTTTTTTRPTTSTTTTTAPGTKSFKAAWINASWLGGRTGTPLSSKGIDPNTGVFGVLCPTSQVLPSNHDPTVTFTNGLTIRNNCSAAIDPAICRTAGSGGGASSIPVCSIDPRQTPRSNVSWPHVGRTIGQPQFIAETPLEFDVNIFWCSDQSTFNFGTVKGLAQLDCIPR